MADSQGGVPLHVHTHEDETFYILEGRFALQVGDQIITAGPGDTVFGPRGVAHSWFCVSDTPGRFVLLTTPGDNFETFAVEMARRDIIPARDMADPALAAQLLALTGQHGLEMLPPGAPIPPADPRHAPFAPLHVPAGEGLFVERGDHRSWGKVGAQHTGGAFLLAETHADFDGGVPPHIHRREDETFVVLEGRFAFLVGGQIVEAGPGDTLFAPRDIVHAWRCTSEGGGRLLILFTPGANFQAFALARDAARMETFVALAERHGIEMLLPIK